MVSAPMSHCRVKPLSSAKSWVSSKRANTGAAAQPKKLEFPMPCTVASAKKAKKDFTTKFAETQTEQLKLDREKLRFETSRFRQEQMLAEKVAKGNFVSSMLQNGQSLDMIKEASELVFPDH